MKKLIRTRVIADREPVFANPDVCTIVGKGDTLTVRIYPNDGGNYKHMHILNKKNEREFHGCVLLDEADYFPHEGKDSIFNSDQKKRFIVAMAAPRKNTGMTNWEYCVTLWNANKTRPPVPAGIKMPDYRKLYTTGSTY